jgi:hypothetical protein
MLLQATFGSGYASLATVGYALYDSDGTLNTARTTTGVYEAPAGSGIYFVDATLPAGFDGFVQWDTGGASPVYASEVIDLGGELDVDPLTGALTTIARVNGLPGIGTYTNDQISAAINAATAAINNYCNRVLTSATYTGEIYDGNDRDYLYLRQYPITAVASITLDDTALTVTTDYEIDTQALYREDYWTAGRRNIVVTYTAGYTTIPEDLVMAVTHIVADMLASEPVNTAIKSEKIGDYQYTLGDSASSAIKKHSVELAPYKRFIL